MPKKIIKIKADGLGPLEIKKIRSALRLCWHRSYSRSLAVKRCIGKHGFYVCEKCLKKTPQLKVDHILKVGEIDQGYISRLFCPSTKLQGLCKLCHNKKTKEERKK
jgi:hypothetical protein